MKILFDGLQHNTSIEVLDLSDNELGDEHGSVICQFLKRKAQVRDDELWWISLRKKEVDEHLKLKIEEISV